MTVIEREAGITRPGLYPGLSRPEYEAIDAINISKLEHFDRSAAHAREAMTHPAAPTDAMEFGTAVHCAILEPSRFAAEYVAAPEVDRRTTKGKQAWRDFEAEHPDATLLDAEDFVAVSRMRDSVWSHPIAMEMLGGAGHNEVGIVFAHEETGLVCKGLLDRVGGYLGWTWVIDLKTTPDARPREFSRSIRTYHYGAKAAYYLDGCNSVAPRTRRFAWIAVEKIPPYGVAVYEADPSAIEAGRSKYSRWLRLYEEAKRCNEWPGYAAEVQTLTAEETEW